VDAGQDRLPGQRRYASRRNAERFGIPISEDNLVRLKTLAG
jgi:delta1-piperideine-2-carboxylate reductase